MKLLRPTASSIRMIHATRSLSLALLPLGTLALVITPAAPAALATWDGSSSDVWGVAANWSTNAVPGNADTALIGLAPNNAVRLTANSLVGVDAITLANDTNAQLRTNGHQLLIDRNNLDGTLTVGRGSLAFVQPVAANPTLPGLSADIIDVLGGGVLSVTGIVDALAHARSAPNFAGFLPGAIPEPVSGAAVLLLLTLARGRVATKPSR